MDGIAGSRRGRTVPVASEMTAITQTRVRGARRSPSWPSFWDTLSVPRASAYRAYCILAVGGCESPRNSFMGAGGGHPTDGVARGYRASHVRPGQGWHHGRLRWVLLVLTAVLATGLLSRPRHRASANRRREREVLEVFLATGLPDMDALRQLEVEDVRDTETCGLGHRWSSLSEESARGHSVLGSAATGIRRSIGGAANRHIVRASIAGGPRRRSQTSGRRSNVLGSCPAQPP